MPKPLHIARPHIAVLGAGLIGLSTADALAARGVRVTVIDARPGPCEGTSFANSGMIHPSQARSWAAGETERDAARVAAQAVADLGRKSRTALHQNMARLKLTAATSRTPGCIQIYETLELARSAQQDFEDLGVKADIAIHDETTFGKSACIFPEDSSANAHDYGVALAADLARRGVTFLYGLQDLDLRRADAGFAIRGKVDGQDQQLMTDQIVVAAGMGSPDLLRLLGVRMALVPIRGHAVDFDIPQGFALPYCPVMDAASRTALTIFEDRLRFSGGWDKPDHTAMMSRWAEIAPHLMARLTDPIATWDSHRPVSPVGRPYISGTSVPGLWVNTGHGHMGWTLCAGSGDLMAAMICDHAQDVRFMFAG